MMQPFSSLIMSVILLSVQRTQVLGHGHETGASNNFKMPILETDDKSEETEDEIKASRKAEEDPNLFGGDMLGITPEILMAKNHIGGRLWKNGVVPYVFDASLKRFKRSIESKFSEYHVKTCIKFKPRTTETDYIVFKNATGCSSYVGRQGGPQPFHLQIPNCINRRNIVHELGHALGLLHTQMRQDRDDHVVLVCRNILAGHERNFRVFPGTILAPYETKSIMHYDSYSFSKNGKPTILKMEDGSIIKRSTSLSRSDVKILRAIYKC